MRKSESLSRQGFFWGKWLLLGVALSFAVGPGSAFAGPYGNRDLLTGKRLNAIREKPVQRAYVPALGVPGTIEIYSAEIFVGGPESEGHMVEYQETQSGQEIRSNAEVEPNSVPTENVDG